MLVARAVRTQAVSHLSTRNGIVLFMQSLKLSVLGSLRWSFKRPDSQVRIMLSEKLYLTSVNPPSLQYLSSFPGYSELKLETRGGLSLYPRRQRMN